MNAAPAEPVRFRLPGTVVRRNFFMHTAVIVSVLAAYHLLSRQESLDALVGAAALAALVLALGYASTAGRVWFTLSPMGLTSIGYTGRKVELPWTTAVGIAKSRSSGYKGHAVALQGAGLLRSGMTAIFIPSAISTTAQFASTVSAWAPPGHVLRTIAHAA